MSELARLALLAQYNQVMNGRQFAVAAVLPAEKLHRDMGAFFHSIWGTLNHILVADILWLKRFAQHKKYPALQPLQALPSPERLDQILAEDLKALHQLRVEVDTIIVKWCAEVRDNDLEEVLQYRNMMGQAQRKNMGALVWHLFIHQTHHRGQVSTLLSQCGLDFGDTDLPEFIPNA